MGNKRISRRRFLGEMSCAGVGATSLFSSLATMRLTTGAVNGGAPISVPNDYKALVCLFLAGGNDSYNMLVPRQQDAYNDYATTRDIIALPKDDPVQENNILPITTTGQSYSDFGLHPKLQRMQGLYSDGNLAFLANTGTLIEPMSRAEYDTRKDLRPRGLFSHSDQQFHWQTVVPQVRGASPGGWAGRAADLMHHVNEQAQLSMNVSLSGVNVFQTGKDTVSFTVSSSGAPDIDAYEDPTEKVAINSMLEQQYKNIYQTTMADRVKNAFSTTERFDEAIKDVTLETAFPGTGTGRNLEMIAKMIAARGPLSMNRQIFYLVRGGWDHHSEVLENQNNLFTRIDEALGAFWDALVELQMEDCVTVFSASDFGRTLTTNGLGSDHAWGGNHFIMGGCVNGGQIFGTYPDLAIGAELDVGRGRLMPTTAVDEYAAELATWFGVPASELSTILPNLCNFIDPLTTPKPIGFMA